MTLPLLGVLILLLTYGWWHRQRQRRPLQRSKVVKAAPPSYTSAYQLETCLTRHQSWDKSMTSHSADQGAHGLTLTQCPGQDKSMASRARDATPTSLLQGGPRHPTQEDVVDQPTSLLQKVLHTDSTEAGGSSGGSSLRMQPLERSRSRPTGSHVQRAPSARVCVPKSASARVHPDVVAPLSDVALPSSSCGERTGVEAATSTFARVSRVSTAARTIRAMQETPQRPAPILAEEKRHPAWLQRAQSDLTHARPSSLKKERPLPARSSPAQDLTRAATLQALVHGGTMFDDGRYLDAIMRQAKADGWLAPERRSSDVPPLLRKHTKMAVSAKPIEKALNEGPSGGGGVRVAPMHLDLSTTAFQAVMTQHFVSRLASDDNDAE